MTWVQDKPTSTHTASLIILLAPCEACLDEAVRSTNDLIDNVLEKYRVWLDTGSLPEEEEACHLAKQFADAMI